jgi:hypothetical protein
MNQADELIRRLREESRELGWDDIEDRYASMADAERIISEALPEQTEEQMREKVLRELRNSGHFCPGSPGGRCRVCEDRRDRIIAILRPEHSTKTGINLSNETWTWSDLANDLISKFGIIDLSELIAALERALPGVIEEAGLLHPEPGKEKEP